MKILKIASLEKGWHDKDKLLLHACFQLLVDYVEKEKGLSGHIDWNWDEPHSHAAREMRSLYRWWTKARPNRKDPCRDLSKKDCPSMEEMFVPVKRDNCSCRRMVTDFSKKYPKYEAALKKSAKLEEKWETEDQQNLHRLIDIRTYLWT